MSTRANWTQTGGNRWRVSFLAPGLGPWWTPEMFSFEFEWRVEFEADKLRRAEAGVKEG